MGSLRSQVVVEATKRQLARSGSARERSRVVRSPSLATVRVASCGIKPIGTMDDANIRAVYRQSRFVDVYEADSAC